MLFFFDIFSYKPPISNLAEIHPVGFALIPEDRQTDGWTDMKKLIGAFHHNENAPKNRGYSLKKYEAQLLGAFVKQMQK